MNLRITSLALMAALTISVNCEAQKLKVTSGKFSALSKHKSFNVVYTYKDGFMVGKKTEKVYLKTTIDKKNKKEAGAGDTWAKKWEEHKVGGYYFDKFETLFNDVLKDQKVSCSRENDKATCTMNVEVYYIDPGYNVGVSRKPAFVSMTVSFVADGKELVAVNMVRAPGTTAMGYDFDAALRISESFEKSGKTLGKTIYKQIYK